MSKKTRATELLNQRDVAYSLHTYAYDANADRIGLQAASAFGVSAAHVLKTLMVLIDGKPACAVLPSDCELSMKKVAAVFGAKSAQMMKVEDAERVTGYKVGGISPFGQKRGVPAVIEERALGLDWAFVNGGLRGLQIRIDPKQIPLILDAKVASVIAAT